MKIPAGIETQINTAPGLLLINFTRGKLKYVSGKEINFFKPCDAFVESNNGGAHYMKNIEKKPALLHMGENQ